MALEGIERLLNRGRSAGPLSCPFPLGRGPPASPLQSLTGRGTPRVAPPQEETSGAADAPRRAPRRTGARGRVTRGGMQGERTDFDTLSMCMRACGRGGRAGAYLQALSPVVGIPITELIQQVVGGFPHLQGA